MKSIKRRIYLIASGFVTILAGLVVVFTAGSIYPNWEFRFAAWYELRNLRKGYRNERH